MTSPDSELRNHVEQDNIELSVGYSGDERPLFLHWYSDLLRDKTNGVLINAYEGQTLIGFLEASIKRGHQGSTFFIEGIRIEDTTRLRRGYGTRMLKKAEQIAQEFGISSIEGLIAQENLASITFFTNNGYSMEEYHELGLPQYRIFKSLQSPKVEHVPTVISLKEAISFLRQPSIEKRKSLVKIFNIDPNTQPIQASDLKQLVTFPFEFSIHEDKGMLKVATGDKDRTTKLSDISVPENTLLYVHTHPQTSGNTFLSFADILATDLLGSRVQQILITKAGMIVYKRPQFDPIRDIPTDEDPRESMAQWGDLKGIDFFGFKARGETIRIFDLQDEEEMRIARDFARDYRMVVKEVNWDDGEGVNETLDAINQKIIISDNEAHNPPSVLDDLNVDLDSVDGPQKPTLRVIAEHIDSVKYKRGILLRDRSMRQHWRDFAIELVDQELKTNPSSFVKDLLLKLKKKAEDLIID